MDLDVTSWYQCEQAPVPVLLDAADDGEETDLFEEAGLYARPERDLSPWTPEALKPKKHRRGGVVAAVIGIAALVGMIVGTSVLFSGTGGDRDGVRADRDAGPDITWEDAAWTSDVITGKNQIERAPTAPEVQMSLLPAEALEPLTLDALYDRCVPSVVAVRGRVRHGYTWGSGIVMTEDGYILTNTHMLDGTESVEVILHDGEAYDAKLVGNDPATDVAVLKIKATGLTPAQFGESDALAVGDRVVAIGNPLSDQFTGTMTEGIVSGKERTVTYGGREMTLLQHTAAINEGNSGGPLFNQYGQAVGITNMKMATSSSHTAVEGIGFAIPMTVVRDTANTLLREGAVAGRPALGVYVYMVEADDSHPAGLLVESAVPGSDAAKKGLQQNDILVEIEGTPITESSVVSDCLADKKVGDSVRVTLWRDGKSIVKVIRLIDQNQF